MFSANVLLYLYCGVLLTDCSSKTTPTKEEYP